MSHPSVRQLQALNEIFKKAIETYPPRRLAVLGCATGNGFEHIRPDTTRSVVGVDVNNDYLDLVERRYGGSLPNLKLVCEDVAEVRFEAGAFNHIHAGLIFEYVEPPKLLGLVATWLGPGGVCSVVLQLPSRSSGPVTATPYDSLGRLEPVMNLVDPKVLVSAAEDVGLHVIESTDVDLESGKKFRVICLKKNNG
jgi:SAM-dependent methyltransferase